MKKIKLLSSIGAVAALSGSVAIVATGCNNGGLEIHVPANIEISNTQAKEITVGLSIGDNSNIQLKNLTATVNQEEGKTNDAVKVIVFSSSKNKFMVVGENKGTATITVSATDVDGNTAYANINVKVVEGEPIPAGAVVNFAGLAIEKEYDGAAVQQIGTATFEDADGNMIEGTTPDQRWDEANGTVALVFTNYPGMSGQTPPEGAKAQLVWDASATNWRVILLDAEASQITSANNGKYYIDVRWVLPDLSKATTETTNKASLTINIGEEEKPEVINIWNVSSYDKSSSFITQSTATEKYLGKCGLWSGVNVTDSNAWLELWKPDFEGTWSGKIVKGSEETDIEVADENPPTPGKVFIGISGDSVAFVVPQDYDLAKNKDAIYTLTYTENEANGRVAQLRFKIWERTITGYSNDENGYDFYDNKTVGLGDGGLLTFTDENIAKTGTTGMVLVSSGVPNGYCQLDFAKGTGGISVGTEEGQLNPELFNATGTPTSVFGYKGTPGQSDFELTCAISFTCAGAAVDENNGSGLFKNFSIFGKFCSTDNFPVENMPAVTIKSDGSDLKDELLDKYVHAGQLVDGILLDTFNEFDDSGTTFETYTSNVRWKTTDSQIIINFNQQYKVVDTETTVTNNQTFVFTKGETNSYFDSIDWCKADGSTGTWYHTWGIFGISDDWKNEITVGYRGQSEAGKLMEVVLALSQLDFNNKITVEYDE